MTLSADIIEQEAALGPVRAEWDALAIECGRPFCAPAWMLSWWHHARPEGGGLHLIAVNDGNRLVGLAPLWTLQPASMPVSAYEVLTDRLSPPVGPLAAPGREREVAALMTRALTRTRPRQSFLRLWDKFGPDDFSRQVVEAWPRRPPWVHAAVRMPTPVVSLEEHDYEAWLEGRSSKFRQEARRRHRRLEELGARIRRAGPDDYWPAIEALLDLHAARWRDRGGSNALVAGLPSMLEEAAAELVPSGRMRIFTIEVEGRVIAANMLLAAGGEVAGWLSGFDEEWGRYSFSMLLALHAIADAAESGESRLNLGPGDMDYKRRLADAQEEITGLTVVPRSAATYPLTRLGLLAYQARWALSARLSKRTKARLRHALPRLA